ncbi:MAG TPA: hypothetical protein VG270_02440 [Pseudolabrys sp.]|nr:hypothetical protein [Pseudolabrys sp.]
MIESTDVRPLPGAEAVPEPNTARARRSRCAHCNGPFGMIRRHRSGRQFCSVRCMDGFDDALREAVRAKARWYDLVGRLRTGDG